MKTIRVGQALSFAAIIFTLALFACTGSSNDKAKSKDVATKEAAKQEIVKEVTDYPIPTSFDVTKMLNEAGASYILSISNEAANADKYFSEKEKAINLGIYGADLAYASTYEMKQETMLYLQAAKKLIEGLEISNNFNLSFAQRVEANIDNKDSLINIITNSFYDTYTFLNNNGKDNLSLLVMSGSFIEGLYITSQIAIGAENTKNFEKIIKNQKNPLSKLMKIMEPAKDDSTMADIYADLAKLQEAYNGIGEELTPEKLSEITELTTSIRQKLI